MNVIGILAIGLAWLLIIAGCWLGWQLLRQNGRILLRLDELESRLNELELGEGDKPEGLPIGNEAPAFELPDLAGQRKSLLDFRGQPLLLIFFNPACGFCRDLAPRLAAMQNERSEVRGQTRILIVSVGDSEANGQLLNDLDCAVLLQKEMEVAAAYKANGTPSGYVIDAEGKIASELAIGAEALLAQANSKGSVQSTNSDAETDGNGNRSDRFSKRSLERSKLKREGLKAGALAPDFRLPRLDGRGELTLSGLRGRNVLLVFSSPGCGPCNTLAPQLEKFHREHPELEVVMVSKGEPKENRAKIKAHELTFPIVLQQQWEISRRYAMFATPIAYLINQEGVITNDVAVGVDPILALVSGAAINGQSASIEPAEPAQNPRMDSMLIEKSES